MSHRARLEHERMERWLAAVAWCAARDAALAREAAAAARLVKGYGDVRRKMTALFDDLLDTTLSAATFAAAHGQDWALPTDFAASYRTLVLKGPDGESQAQALAAALRTHIAANDHEAALSILRAPSAVR
jgi:hypothetical protein